MCRFKFCFSFALLVLLHFYVDNCSACGGYKMKLISVDNCDENNVITIDKNFTAVLDADCMLQTFGCIKSKGFKEAKVKYTISKNGNELLSGHPDICNALDHKSEEQKSKLELFGFPTACPVPEEEKCMDGSKKVDISKYKNLLPMAAGKITAHYDVTHDTGKTCTEIRLEISK